MSGGGLSCEATVCSKETYPLSFEISQSLTSLGDESIHQGLVIDETPTDQSVSKMLFSRVLGAIVGHMRREPALADDGIAASADFALGDNDHLVKQLLGLQGGHQGGEATADNQDFALHIGARDFQKQA